ncbi:DUF1800 domain-containing protein [Spirosoma taeanense]|uniref:DUF1800 domain-containing protein n=1 Tax=Spirosoma taeanense TaxID=2735870 RepID=A0A6M5YAR3_9BACT|nr:DUF1800 domain-containing protein [Spirosoma taeanense]QJW91065.1 DUF1800 domain-containing protein [Spirosoma taeanense]
MSAWNVDSARHLLARCLFGYSRADLTRALSYPSAQAFVQQELLADLPPDGSGQPDPPGPWVTEAPVTGDNAVNNTRYRELTNWWLSRMLTEVTSMREKMVLFWHNHFTSQRDKISYPQYMYQQNALFRRYAFGDFGQMTKEVTIDPAMLIYLDGRQNNKNAPNENYARELMELFTLGLGNYTETDVKQAALALTGWRLEGLKAVFNKKAFASTNKTFLGKTGNFGYTDIIDIILTKDATAEFISRKLYREFVHYQPNEPFVRQMAAVLREANYQIKPLLQFLLTSDEFFRTDYRGGKIKSPTELLIGAVKQLALAKPDWAYLADTGRLLQQQLFNPPNVAGWSGQREWISSNTYPARGGFTDSLVNGRKSNGQMLAGSLNALDYARSYASSENAIQFVNDVTGLLLRFPLSDTKRKFLLETLLDGTIAANWSTNTPMADIRIQKFLKAVMRQPEYQLT